MIFSLSTLHTLASASANLASPTTASREIAWPPSPGHFTRQHVTSRSRITSQRAFIAKAIANLGLAEAQPIFSTVLLSNSTSGLSSGVPCYVSEETQRQYTPETQVAPWLKRFPAMAWRVQLQPCYSPFTHFLQLILHQSSS